ncbi:PEPxxWA-CTERM sorting domain-containing protein [Sphingomonas flavescens]|uniref:PEPxxWA-CTERM sorting domain-containing protein n=1 Tax=Sphingomonas flavescens TaxID=3132797 RepID=UPI00280383FE|nr:PEPxxWA-CTERM sorting domain-containing protein [Sphingomonas limnosediminicola]
MATSANAAGTLTTATSNLNTHIQAQGAVAGDPLSTINDALSVYGTTGITSSDVKFTGDTAIHITDGGGFALIRDSNQDDATLFKMLVIDPNLNFTALQFSASLLTASNILVQYSTVAGGANNWINAIMGADNPPLQGVSNPIGQNANTNKDYTLTATGGDIFTAVRISTCAGTTIATCTPGTGGGFQYIKQNSITLAPGAVPEPATWAMMLLGFGGIGMTMRRKQRRTGALMQVA